MKTIDIYEQPTTKKTMRFKGFYITLNLIENALVAGGGIRPHTLSVQIK